jgi:hypothetical protein
LGEGKPLQSGQTLDEWMNVPYSIMAVHQRFDHAASIFMAKVTSSKEFSAVRLCAPNFLSSIGTYTGSIATYNN